PGPSARANRDPETRARQAAALVCPDRPTAQRAHRRAGRRRVPARLQDRPRGHRVEAARVALPIRPIPRLADHQEHDCDGGQTRGRGRVGLNPSGVLPWRTTSTSRCSRRAWTPGTSGGTRNPPMTCAKLREADLREADLRGADLNAANLSEADLSLANLRGAN